MIARLRSTLVRCAPTLAEDVAGVAALAVMLVIGLHLPLFF